MAPRWKWGSRSVGEDVPLGFAIPRHEKVQDLVLQRKEVLEEPLQLVGAPSPRLTEVLELVLEDLFARPSVEHEEHDVEEKPGLLHVHLPVVGPAVDRRLVLLGLVSGAVLDAKLEASGDEDLAAGLHAERPPELGRAPELREILRRELQVGRQLDHFELRLLLDLLLQETLELRLQVDVLKAPVARLLGLGGDHERREHDLLVAAKRKPRLQRKLEADLRHAGEGGRGSEGANQHEEERASTRLTSHRSPFPWSG